MVNVLTTLSFAINPVINAGQAVIFTLSLADGSQVEIIAYNPFIIIDGIGYKCKYEPCEALNHYANELMTREP